MERFTGLLGILVILGVAFLVSTSRKSIQRRVLVWGLTLQFGFAFLVLKTNVGSIFELASVAVNALLDYAEKGSEFLFGPLGIKAGPYGVIFAFQVLPIVIFIASVFAVLYQLGVMQIIVRAMAIVMQRVMGASGAESTSVAASIFTGHTEAPLTIRPSIVGLTTSELRPIMPTAMAPVSGAVMEPLDKIAPVD